jgi:hypothetical protein
LQELSEGSQAAVLRAAKAVAAAWPANKVPELMALLLTALPTAPAALWLPLTSSILSVLPSPDALAAFTVAALTPPELPEASGTMARAPTGGAKGKWALEVLARVYERESIATVAEVLGRLLLEDGVGVGVITGAPARQLVSFAAEQLQRGAGGGAGSGGGEGLQKVLEASIVQLQLLHQVCTTVFPACGDG